MAGTSVTPEERRIKELEAELRDIKSFVVGLRGSIDKSEYQGLNDAKAENALLKKEKAELVELLRDASRRAQLCECDLCDLIRKGRFVPKTSEGDE